MPTASPPLCDQNAIVPRETTPDLLRRGTLRRALHLINGEHYSGAERVQDLLSLALPSFGYDVAFACVRPGKFPARRVNQQVPLQCFPMRGRWGIGILQPVARFAREWKADLLHAHTPRTALVAGWLSRWTGIPWVYHVHSPTSADSTRAWQNRVNAWAERWSLANVERLITVSASLADHMIRSGYPADMIHVVPNGVPSVACLPDRSPPGGAWTLGTVALMRPRKGIEVLLDALHILRERGHAVRLLAVGPFETAAYEQQLKQRCVRLNLVDCVEWTGFCTDVSAEMRRMDLFALPSLFGEGMPMVVLEAMAVGVPVVASRVEGVPEAIRDGTDGLLCDAQSPTHLADRIGQIMASDESHWREMRASAHRRQQERFSTESMSRGVADVYDEVLARRHPRTP